MAEVSPADAPMNVRRVAIVCESTSCLPPELVQRYHIGIIPIPFVFDAQTFLNGVDMTPAEFYARLAASHTPPKTSPPSPGTYLEAWTTAAQCARAVVLVTVDSKISTMQRSALFAQELAHEALLDTPIAIVDSLSAGMGQGFVALAAARAAQDGGTLDDVVAAADRVRWRVRMIVTLDTLEYLARTSRIPQVAAFVGGLLSIKPVVELSGGDIHLLARVRTRRRSIEELFGCMQRAIPADAQVHVAVQHASAPEEAAALEERVRGAFSCVELFTTEFTPVMGGYCGPGLLGAAFYTE
jgi:DegV family protein with EDD domain